MFSARTRGATFARAGVLSPPVLAFEPDSGGFRRAFEREEDSTFKTRTNAERVLPEESVQIVQNRGRCFKMKTVHRQHSEISTREVFFMNRHRVLEVLSALSGACSLWFLEMQLYSFPSISLLRQSKLYNLSQFENSTLHVHTSYKASYK